ncbi:hypothetical protein [Leptothoe spongobia]|uniref:Uncharacterized protein n=1 Tax=Leptothoe spongobia TAU-MAC 1115 TaxID=1967444 RepID=A0A947DL94_9CYAN|nr:hypothetical protein [Leptothoe spongobia]MBT9318045.1 hypothetical protein [Leptothoe spongobia TAU-MAC 1115]
MDDASGLYQQQTADYAFDISYFSADAQTDSSKKDPIDGPDLESLLEELKQQSQAIRDSGKVAPTGVYVDKYSSKGKPRVRVRTTTGKNIPGTHQKSKGLGRFGGAQHRDWEARCDRRHQLQKVERRALIIQQWIEEDKK